MLKFLSRGRWSDTEGRKGFSSCFQLLHPWLAVQVWGQLARLCSSHVPRISGHSVTFQSPPGLVNPLLFPPVVDAAYSSCHHWCTNSFSVTCPLPAVCLYPRGELLAFPVNRTWPGQTNELLSSPADGNHTFSNKIWTQAMGRLPWLSLFSGTLLER